VRVYSSGPRQPDSANVEQPTGVGGTSALVYSSGPEQLYASALGRLEPQLRGGQTVAASVSVGSADVAREKVGHLSMRGSLTACDMYLCIALLLHTTVPLDSTKYVVEARASVSSPRTTCPAQPRLTCGSD
jgi:hypothetical protein